MPVAFIGVGSNIAPEENVTVAVRHLGDAARIFAVSMFYESAPVTRPEQGDYYNGIIACETEYAPARFKLAVLRRIEGKLGRVRVADKHAPRTIDLDLVAYGASARPRDILVIDADVASLAHLAVPFAELAPDVVLENGVTVAARARALDARALRPLAEFTAELRVLARASSVRGDVTDGS